MLNVDDHTPNAAIAIVGIAYILFFIPVCWAASVQEGLQFPDTLLFIQVPPHVEKAFEEFFFPKFYMETDLPFLSALGVLYGVLCITRLLVGTLNAPYKLISLVISSNGIFWGYYLSLFVADYLLDTIDFTWKSYRIYIVKFLYIYALFLLSTTLKEKMFVSQPWRPGNGMLFDGLFGILATYIMVLGYGENILNIVQGPIFLALSYFIMIIFEHTILRFVLSLMVAMMEFMQEMIEREDKDEDEDEHVPDKRIVWIVLRRLMNLWKINMREPVYLTAQKMQRIHQTIEEEYSQEDEEEDIRINVKMLLVFVILIAIWPILFAGAYWYISIQW